MVRLDQGLHALLGLGSLGGGWPIRILVAGASGVLGRATLPHLARHDVVGLTRTPAKTRVIDELGAEGIVCDVYDRPALRRVVQQARPQIVVNFLTDLSAGAAEPNNRVRREGAANLLDGARAAGAARLVAESVAFALDDDGTRALTMLERSTLAFPGEAVILRFGRLWGAGTFHQAPPDRPRIEIGAAGAEAARLITGAKPGTYAVVDPD